MSDTAMISQRTQPDKIVIMLLNKQEELSAEKLNIFLYYLYFYRTFKRTEGISTTDIVGRLLLMTKTHHFQAESEETKKLRKMSGEEGIVVANLKEDIIIQPEKTKKIGFLIK